ncbi:MAG: bis-aminopropyl spermidine synthase family protein [bacterium]
MNITRRKIFKKLLEKDQVFLKLLENQESPLEFMKELHSLYKENLITLSANKYFTITEKGKRYANTLRFLPGKVRCELCQGKGIDTTEYQCILTKFKEIVKDRPLPVNEYDQGPVTPEDSLRRVLFMLERGDLQDKRILILGDDDLISIVIAMMKVTERITVVEIDQRLIEFIEASGLNIEITHYNAEETLTLPIKYSTFITDPVETIEGWKLFLSRGISCLDKCGTVYFALTSLRSSREKWYEFQRLISEMGLIITDMLRDFSTYPMETNILKSKLENGEHFMPKKMTSFLEEFLFSQEDNYEDSKWYTSTFVRAEAINEPRPLIIGNYKLGNIMYKDNEGVEIESCFKKLFFEIYKDLQSEKQ